MSNNGEFKDHLLLVDDSVRQDLETLLEENLITDHSSYVRFLNLVAVKVAVGKVPPSAAKAISELAGQIYQAVTLAGMVDMASKSSGSKENLLPEPTPGRVLDVKIVPSYSSDAVTVKVGEEIPDE